MIRKNLLVILDELSRPDFNADEPRLKEVNVSLADVHDQSKIEELARTADIVLLFSWKPSRELLRRILAINPGIRWVHTWWTGVDALLFPELKSFEVVLTNGRGGFAPPLAEFVIASILYFAKEFPRCKQNQRDRRWQQFENELLVDKTIGIYGYGEIGRAVAARAKAFEMRVIGVRRTPVVSEDPTVRIVGDDQFLEMCFSSDYVVCAAPLTESTAGRFNRTAFQAMKASAVFVNVGRGPVVVEADLIDALLSRKLRAATLDVFETEPLAASSPLWGMDNVLISAHCADRYPGWMSKCVDIFLDNLEAYLNGGELRNKVDLMHGY